LKEKTMKNEIFLEELRRVVQIFSLNASKER